MTETKTITGLTCPNCSGVLAIPEGARLVICPFCEMRHIVAGERGVQRYQVPRKIDRATAQRAVQQFWGGINKAWDLSQNARIEELFLAYLPYWRVQAQLAGWLFGRVRRGKNNTKPAEVMVAEEVRWNDAACDVAEFGVQQIRVTDADMAAYNGDALRAEGMVFEPTESRTEALDQAHAEFMRHGRSRGKLTKRFFERFQFLREQLALVYYPLWVSRYSFKGRAYQVVVDGQRGDIVYGKAPGNIIYRAAILVLGMGAGNFLLVNGTMISLWVVLQSNSDDAPLWLPLIILAAGIGIVIWAYRTFRYGEEVEVGAAKKSPTGELGDSIKQMTDLLSKFGD